jgi:uncharacterized membrane protein
MDENALAGDWLAVVVTMIVAIALVAASVPLMRGRVKPNRTYGFKTRKTLSDERVWYAANQILGKDMFLTGIATLLLITVALPIWHFVSNLPIAILPIATFTMVAASVVHRYWALHKM